MPLTLADELREAIYARISTASPTSTTTPVGERRRAHQPGVRSPHHDAARIRRHRGRREVQRFPHRAPAGHQRRRHTGCRRLDAGPALHHQARLRRAFRRRRVRPPQPYCAGDGQDDRAPRKRARHRQRDEGVGPVLRQHPAAHQPGGGRRSQAADYERPLRRVLQTGDAKDRRVPRHRLHACRGGGLHPAVGRGRAARGVRRLARQRGRPRHRPVRWNRNVHRAPYLRRVHRAGRLSPQVCWRTPRKRDSPPRLLHRDRQHRVRLRRSG